MDNPINASQPGSNQECTEDSFTYLKKIGAGSFGLVYKVQETQTKAIFAIKTIFHPKDSLPKEFVISQQLNHPNTIKIHKTFITKSDDDPPLEY
jgi:serine/threonine protein kinase